MNQVLPRRPVDALAAEVVETAAKQGEQVLVDACGTSMTAEQAPSQIVRVQGNVAGLAGRATVLTKDGVVKF